MSDTTLLLVEEEDNNNNNRPPPPPPAFVRTIGRLGISSSSFRMCTNCALVPDPLLRHTSIATTNSIICSDLSTVDADTASCTNTDSTRDSDLPSSVLPVISVHYCPFSCPVFVSVLPVATQITC